MSSTKRILIVGHPGAGKTVLGEALAEKLHWQYIDADFGLELMIGAPSEEIFGSEGNRHLRQTEEKILQENSTLNNIILNTDVGIVLSENNRKLIKHHYYVVFVTVDLETQKERLSMHRPALLKKSHRDALITDFRKRDTFFDALSDITVNTSSGSVDTHVKAVLNEAKLTAIADQKKSIQVDAQDSLHLHRTTHRPVELTQQQATVLKSLANGKSAKEIAQTLEISPRTVEGHIATMKALLGCVSSKELISLYLSK